VVVTDDNEADIDGVGVVNLVVSEVNSTYRTFIANINIDDDDTGKYVVNIRGNNTLTTATVLKTFSETSRVWLQQESGTERTQVTVESGETLNGVTDGVFELISEINGESRITKRNGALFIRGSAFDVT